MFSMSAERAKTVLDMAQGFSGEVRYAFPRPCDIGDRTHKDGVTREERVALNTAWSRLPGWTTLSLVLSLVADGKITFVDGVPVIDAQTLAQLQRRGA